MWENFWHDASLGDFIKNGRNNQSWSLNPEFLGVRKLFGATQTSEVFLKIESSNQDWRLNLRGFN